MTPNAGEFGSNPVSTSTTSGACPACGSGRRRRLGTKDSHQFWVCARCGTIATAAPSGVSGVEEVRDLYNHYYEQARFELPRAAAFSLHRLVRSAERFRSTGRWLDVGYGEGGLLAIVESEGWACYGTEVSPHSLEFGGRRGWTVSRDGGRDPRFPARGFDVVSMVELIEHATDPGSLLSEAARWLRPGGLLYITTPNAQSLNCRVQGLAWSVFSPPEHLTIWTAKGLRIALKNEGFSVSRVRTHGLNPTEIVASLRIRLRPSAAGDTEVSRNQAAFRLNEAFSRSRARRAIKGLLNFGLNLAGIGDGLKVWATR